MLDKLRNQAELLTVIDKDKYTLIKNILKNDNCFFEMSMEDAYSLLRDLKVREEDLKIVYLSLMKIENTNM